VKPLVLFAIVISLIAATAVSAYLDCSPSACSSGYTDNGVTCAGDICTRSCTISVCSGNWTQVYSSNCGSTLWNEDEQECSTGSYNSSNANLCYNFTYDGPTTVQMDGKDPPSGYSDCDSEGIGGFFENAKNTPHPWFENLTPDYLGDVSYTAMDYLWRGSRGHAEEDSDFTYQSDFALDDRLFCAPNTVACSLFSAGECSANCYNHITFGYGYQGYVVDYGYSSNENLYRNDGCGNSNAYKNQITSIGFIVSAANLTDLHNDKVCYRDNEAPNASNVTVLPLSPDAGDDLFCNFTYSDAENFTERESSYEWWKNSSNQ
jgi:hypothetical protein